MRMDRMPQMDREVASTTQEEAEKSEMNVEGFRVFRVLWTLKPFALAWSGFCVCVLFSRKFGVFVTLKTLMMVIRTNRQVVSLYLSVYVHLLLAFKNYQRLRISSFVCFILYFICQIAFKAIKDCCLLSSIFLQKHKRFLVFYSESAFKTSTSCTFWCPS